MIIGLTGPSGSGKSHILRLWASLGALTVDADAVYHELLRGDPTLRASILQRFPAASGAGGIDRPALARIVFSDPGALHDLEALTHPAVMGEVRRRIDGAGRPVVVEAIALFECGFGAECDVSVAVTADDALRLRRLTARDGRSEGEILARMASAKPAAWYAGCADYVLDGGAEHIERDAAALYKRLTGGAAVEA